jgi:hypothetical protein
VIATTDERLLAAGAALEDLDSAEAAAWATHRVRCAGCRTLAGDLSRVLVDLALAVPNRVPPPSLLAAVRRSIGTVGTDSGAPGSAGSPAGAAVGRAATPGPGAPIQIAVARDRRDPRHPRRALVGMAVVVGLAAVVGLSVAGLLVAAISLQRDPDRTA